MNTKNEKAVFPIVCGPEGVIAEHGLTKLEHLCIKHKTPRTGDPDIDVLLAYAELRDLAGLAMQGILANRLYEPPRRQRLAGMAEDAVNAARALLAELSKESEQ
jgi:hypothetical protein